MQDLQNEVTSLRKKLAHAKQHSIMAGRDGAAAGNYLLSHVSILETMNPEVFKL